MNTDHNNRIPHKFNQNLCKTMFCINLFHFTKCGQICDIFSVGAKSTAEPRNSNDLLMANNSAPCAFFIRSTRTPQQNGLKCPFSMVACSGKGFALCCVPLVAVFEPVTRYRPSLETLRGNSLNLTNGVHAMKQFIFAAIRRTDLTNHIVKIRINADTEQEARKPLAREFVLVLAGRINLRATKNLVNDTFNQGLSANKNACSIVGTTTQNGGNRSRYERGIFLSQIPFNGYEPAGYTYHSEFAVRATHGNKAEIIRANNVGYHNPFSVVVEPLPRLLSVRNSKFTNKLNGNPTMKIYPQNNRTLATFPALSVSAEMEVAHA